jgi:hypothetical protein
MDLLQPAMRVGDADSPAQQLYLLFIHQPHRFSVGMFCIESFTRTCSFQSDEVNPKAFPLAGPDLSVTILELVQQVRTRF